MAADKWKEASIRTIKVAQTVVAKTENDIDNAVGIDPLPSLRDRCVRETNRRIHSYARSVRAVVVKLRQSFVAVNEQMKSMNRVKEHLWRSLNATRRLMNINVHTVQLRQERPLREKKLSDSADESLKLEYEGLICHKRQTETQLQTVLTSLQVLGCVRANLSSILQERARATELLCHSVSSSQRFVGKTKRDRHVKSLSAPAKTQVDDLPDVLTAPVEDVLCNADKAIAESQHVKKESFALIEDLNRQQMLLRDAVNGHLVQRIAQTATITQHLDINNGEARMTMQATQKHLSNQEKSLGYSMGPISSRDITIREKLDRPLVKVYQSHPGTDLPEAAYLIGAGNKLTDSINITQRNIALLKLARKKMKEDSRDKQIAMSVDSDILRLRKRETQQRMLLVGTAVALKTN